MRSLRAAAEKSTCDAYRKFLRSTDCPEAAITVVIGDHAPRLSSPDHDPARPISYTLFGRTPTIKEK
jgi:hypothetical protein